MTSRNKACCFSASLMAVMFLWVASASAVVNCDGPVVDLAEGGSTTATDSTGPTNGSATVTCTGGAYVYSGVTCATAADTTPDAFSFTDVTGAAVNTLTTSNTITISGISSGTAVSVSGAGSPQISINGGAWGTSGTITNGQTLRVRLTAAATINTARTATVDVGGVTDVWSVTTITCIPDNVTAPACTAHGQCCNGNCNTGTGICEPAGGSWQAGYECLLGTVIGGTTVTSQANCYTYCAGVGGGVNCCMFHSGSGNCLPINSPWIPFLGGDMSWSATAIP